MGLLTSRSTSSPKRKKKISVATRKRLTKSHEESEELVAVFDSGAKRSQKLWPTWHIPQEWKREIAKRFHVGHGKYGIGNCYKAIGTGDLDYIRGFWEHVDEHLAGFMRTVVNGPDTEPDGRKEGPLDHLGAALWGCGMLITYTIFDEANVRKAFDVNTLKKISEEKEEYAANKALRENGQSA